VFWFGGGSREQVLARAKDVSLMSVDEFKKKSPHTQSIALELRRPLHNPGERPSDYTNELYQRLLRYSELLNR
jgi:hypothetical protein